MPFYVANETPFLPAKYEGFVKEVQLKRRIVQSLIFSFTLSSCYNLLPFHVSPDLHPESVFKQTKTQKIILIWIIWITDISKGYTRF